MVNHVIHLVFVALLLPATLAHAQSKYVRRDAQNQQTIVFVHGVPGNSVDTWTNDLTKAYWPTLLAEDSDFSGANIFVVDYSSSCTRLGPSIDELAESLRLALESQGVLRSPEIVFVSHSMGGLVTSTLLKFREVAKNVKLLYFIATTGSSVALIATLLSRIKMMPMTSDAYLADVQRAWLASKDLRLCHRFVHMSYSRRLASK